MNPAQIKTIFHFHGLRLPVIEHQGQEFIPIKPIIELIGIDYKGAKRALSSGHKAEFFAFCQLSVANYDGLGEASFPIPVILFRRVHFYIAQINPDAIKVQGNTAAADMLVKLHEEWAQALFDYETTGIAVKQSHNSRLKELMQLRKSAVGQEVSAFNHMIAQELQGWIAPEENGQPKLI